MSAERFSLSKRLFRRKSDGKLVVKKPPPNKRGGYSSSDKTVDELKKPPTGPAPGAPRANAVDLTRGARIPGLNLEQMLTHSSENMSAEDPILNNLGSNSPRDEMRAFHEYLLREQWAARQQNEGGDHGTDSDD